MKSHFFEGILIIFLLTSHVVVSQYCLIWHEKTYSTFDILLFCFMYRQLCLREGRNSYFMDWNVFCLYCDTFLQNISFPWEISDCFHSEGKQFVK